MVAASRSQFAKLAVVTVVIGVTLGGILSPPDPFSQLRTTGVLIGAGFVGSYWLGYQSTLDRPELGWGDLFRWYVSTHLFVFVSILLIDPDTVVDGPASRLLQVGLFLIGAGLAWVVAVSDRIPWPGDR